MWVDFHNKVQSEFLCDTTVILGDVCRQPSDGAVWDVAASDAAPRCEAPPPRCVRHGGRLQQHHDDRNKNKVVKFTRSKLTWQATV